VVDTTGDVAIGKYKKPERPRKLVLVASLVESTPVLEKYWKLVEVDIPPSTDKVEFSI
jgi:hypothetical protein